jgi:hypothetical protein
LNAQTIILFSIIVRIYSKVLHWFAHALHFLVVFKNIIEIIGIVWEKGYDKLAKICAFSIVLGQNLMSNLAQASSAVHLVFP